MDKNSSYIKEISLLLDSIKGEHQDYQQRIDNSIFLAKYLLKAALISQTSKEKRDQKLFTKLITNIRSRSFIINIIDQGFRSHSYLRRADQILHLIHQYGIPENLSISLRFKLLFLKLLKKKGAAYLVTSIGKKLNDEFSHLVFPSEKDDLLKKKNPNNLLNFSQVGGLPLGREGVKKWQKKYRRLLEKPNINYISIKSSSLLPKINLLDWEASVKFLATKLQYIYQIANENPIKQKDGTTKHKFINIDIENYQSVKITIQAFKQALSNPSFANLSAGITLQSYLPEAFELQKDLVQFAKKRIEDGGNAIKITIVKGSYLEKEEIQASINNWAQAPYTSKKETDANFKKMLEFACLKPNARVANVGIATHNIFDIAYGLLLIYENEIFPYAEIEMFATRTPNIRNVINQVFDNVRLYCPVADKNEFHKALSFIFRRIDENLRPQNFLYKINKLTPRSKRWDQLKEAFFSSCEKINNLSHEKRQKQDRLENKTFLKERFSLFDNEQQTNFSLKNNRIWANEIIKNVKTNTESLIIPLQINGQIFEKNQDGIFHQIASKEKTLYHYSIADENDINKAILCANSYLSIWKNVSVEEKMTFFSNITSLYKQKRKELIATLIKEQGKILIDADVEICQAIDSIEYYKFRYSNTVTTKDVSFSPIGTCIIVSSKGNSLSTPTGNIISALLCGNSVIFKPSKDSVLTGWQIVNTFWEAGIPKEVLQFIICDNEVVENSLINTNSNSKLIFSGRGLTAKKFIKKNPLINISANLEGKNTMIITDCCDRDLAIESLVKSAFSNSGQNDFTITVAILESEVYEDKIFLQKLIDAVSPYKLGFPWDLSTNLVPLRHEIKENLKIALTTLEPGESWLLTPKQNENNPFLYSPGIKIGATENSLTFKRVFAGPVLSLVRASNLKSAISIANSLPYGLISVLQSLDEREHHYFSENIQTGSKYINRATKLAMIRRQPYGGYKSSSYGINFKEGGPNYLLKFLKASQIEIPKQKQPVSEKVNSLTSILEKIDLTAEELGLFYASIANYAFWWKKMKKYRDPSKIVGQDNFFGYIPKKNICLKIFEDDNPIDILRICAATLTCGAKLQISRDKNKCKKFYWLDLLESIFSKNETDDQLLERLKKQKTRIIRLSNLASKKFKTKVTMQNCYVIDDPVLANGRYELLNYLQEVNISYNYHRYGNLGVREGEFRKPLF
jgi:RHH-type transcriptional regulator, proline utilization regulon repressor / proline dehydrogenase / delta 1-pyrroline-5-carboxylate dehydrogenase